MRNLLIIFFLILSLSAFSKGRYNNRSGNFNAGVLAGFTASQVDGDGYGGYHKIGINTGLFVYRKFSKHFDAQMDIAYTQRGSIKNPNAEAEDYDKYYLKLHYLDLPIVCRYRYRQFAVEGGLYASSLLSSTEGNENGDYVSTVPLKEFEAGTIIGLNYFITPKIWITTRYTYSLTAIRTPGDTPIEVYSPTKNELSGATGQFNNVISITLNYSFSNF